MADNKELDLLFIGHFAKDRNVVDGHGKTESGGGIYFGSVVARRMGLRVGVVTRLHADDFPLLDELKREGIQVFATAAPETSGIENTYKSTDMERRICKPLGFAGTIQIAELPNVSAKIYVIASIIAGEVDLPLLKVLASRGPVALDIQGFVRVREGNDLVFRPWAQMAEGLKYVTYLKVDRAEAEHLTGETDLTTAARRLREYGPREIVLTQSSGVTVFADGKMYQAPFTPRSLAGRTGRGDTCFSSYLSKRLTSSPEEACRFAGAVTTAKQEKPGPWDGTLP
ncbi:MAG: carbohydrate kinase [Chloroflexi bacterium]|nr:carbohydrate kinase [Chloroflexota bacterium]